MKYTHDVLIQRYAPDVFAYMDDVSREPEWQPNLVEATQDPPGPTAVGTRKRYVSQFLGKRIENTYVTKVYEPVQRVVYETTPDSVLRATVEVRFEDEGGATRVTMAFDGKVSGPLRFIPEGILKAAYESELESTLQRLKGKLEG